MSTPMFIFQDGKFFFYFGQALNVKCQIIYSMCHLQKIVVGNCINWLIQYVCKKRQQSVSGIHGSLSLSNIY